jgi:DNA mismatch repair protein MutH
MMWRIILSIVLITTFIAVAALTVKKVIAWENASYKEELKSQIETTR